MKKLFCYSLVCTLNNIPSQKKKKKKCPDQFQTCHFQSQIWKWMRLIFLYIAFSFFFWFSRLKNSKSIHDYCFVLEFLFPYWPQLMKRQIRKSSVYIRRTWWKQPAKCNGVAGGPGFKRKVNTSTKALTVRVVELKTKEKV